MVRLLSDGIYRDSYHLPPRPSSVRPNGVVKGFEHLGQFAVENFVQPFVYLGFAGRRASDHAVHQAIAALSAGDPLGLQKEWERWALMDGKGNTVGWLARAYAPPARTSCIAASVAAIIMREREDSEPQYWDQALCERWEVVVPDLVFAPEP